MNEDGKEQLHSLLFKTEGELVNVKFFPGNGADLTSNTLSRAAAEMLSFARSAWESGEPSTPPTTGMPKARLLA